MLNRDQYTGCTVSMGTSRCFEKLSEGEKSVLDAKSVIISYKKGEIITKKGSFASHVMYMVSGLAKVYLDDGVNVLVLKIVPPGKLFGLSSLSEENTSFQYSSMAYMDSEIKLIEVGVFKEMLEKNSAFAKEVIETLSANNAQINGRFFCLTHKQSYGRLADIILCLSDMIFKTKEFSLPLSRKELAELSGMSAETVVRMLKKFNDDGLIALDGKNIQLKDYSRLKKISESG
ncbi:MAG: Crp/Fnr family transcriptional regulator [Bacteroidetes bacterium]|nr:Crp/Fnr family transcriptional regulator [Bacteroidota bacterium]